MQYPPTAQKASQWGRLGRMRSYLDGMTKDKPPVYWPRTREAVYLGDIDESRRIVVERLQYGLYPGDIYESHCPSIQVGRATDCTGARALGVRGGNIQVVVSQGEHKMSGLHVPSPALYRSSAAYVRGERVA